MSGRRMNARIPVTDEVQKAVRAFADGAGVTYDDLLRWFLGRADVKSLDEKEAMIGGLEYRGTIDKYKPERESA